MNDIFSPSLEMKTIIPVPIRKRQYGHFAPDVDNLESISIPTQHQNKQKAQPIPGYLFNEQPLYRVSDIRKDLEDEMREIVKQYQEKYLKLLEDGVEHMNTHQSKKYQVTATNSHHNYLT